MKKSKLQQSDVIVVFPAYNAQKTLTKTYLNLPKEYRNNTILIDDKSRDQTVKIAKKLGIEVISHADNKGYGANQKTCYTHALNKNSNNLIIVMIHPDYQYDSGLIELLITPIRFGYLDIVLGNRIRTRKEALEGRMPLYKYILNRILSLIENILLGVNLGEHLSGMRAYRRNVIETIPYEIFSDDFVFDQQLLVSSHLYGFRIGDIPIPTRYDKNSSSIGITKGTKYLWETCIVLLLFVLHKMNIYSSRIFRY